MQPGRVIDFAAPTRFSFGCNNLEVTAMAAIQGVGMARLPAWRVVDALKEGRLLQVFDEPLPFGYALNAVWPQARALPLETRVVIDMLADRTPPLLAPLEDVAERP